MKNLITSVVGIVIVNLSTGCSDRHPKNKPEEMPIHRQEQMMQLPVDGVATIGEDLQICTELLPPPAPNLHISFEADTTIYFRDKKKNDTIVVNSFTPTVAYMASLKHFTWEPTTDLKVTFLDGSKTIQDRVIATAKEWEKHCGIRFIFGNFPDPDISISFMYEGSWSCIGSYSRRMSPSMNFGWLYADTPQEEYDRVVLHEFGHALGYIHEHQNPEAKIQWDSARVYQYYRRTNNWDKPKVDQNIFTKYGKDQLNGSKFDPLSIMLYAIPASLTKNGYSTTSNSQLSKQDKEDVDGLYPQRLK